MGILPTDTYNGRKPERRRVRVEREPPELAREAGAASETLPQLQPHDLEAIGRYCNGRIYPIYPGYPEPEVAEAERALSLATILVRHADERVPVILDERRLPAQCGIDEPSAVTAKALTAVHHRRECR